MSKTSLPQTPTVDSDYALAEPVGDNLHRLYLIADWQRATICFETRHESENGIPMRQWHGHQASWHIPIMGRTMAAELLEELRPLVARVCTGYSGQWDGQNHVARFDDDAQDTRDEIDRVIDNLDWQDTGTGGLWAAGDWLQGDPPTVAVDTNMKELSAEMQGTAHYEAIHLHGLDTYLEELQAEAREQARCADISDGVGTCGREV